MKSVCTRVSVSKATHRQNESIDCPTQVLKDKMKSRDNIHVAYMKSIKHKFTKILRFSLILILSMWKLSRIRRSWSEIIDFFKRPAGCSLFSSSENHTRHKSLLFFQKFSDDSHHFEKFSCASQQRDEYRMPHVLLNRELRYSLNFQLNAVLEILHVSEFSEMQAKKDYSKLNSIDPYGDLSEMCLSNMWQCIIKLPVTVIM